MGEVYLATQLSMQRDVALKILPGQFALQDGSVDRFLQEVKMAARLNHPNIVRAYEAGQDHGVYFLAMDYVEGTAIDGRLRNSGAMPEAEVRIIAEKLGRALDQIWEKHRMIHRDIKPANIMLNEYGEPLLMDMGLSKAIDDGPGMTVSTAIMGSPNYMSPEQAEGAENLDFRTDMYSLGATFYHMLTGRVPFKGKSVMEVLRKQATESLPDPREFNPDISDGMVRIIERMMAKRVENRYPNWQAFLTDLESLVFGGGPAGAGLNPGESVILRASELSQELDSDEESDGDAESSNSGLMIGGIVVATVIAVIGIFLFSRSGNDTKSPDKSVATEPQAKAAKPAPAMQSSPATENLSVELARGLIGHWSFEEGKGTNVADLSGNDLNGFLQGKDVEQMWVPDAAPVPFAGRWAVRISARKNLVKILTDSTLGIRANVTMSGWVKLHSTLSGLSSELMTRGGNNGLRLTVEGLAVVAHDRGFSATPRYRYSSLFEVDKWTHLAATYDGRELRTYFNAGLPGTLPAPGLIRETKEPIHLGWQGGAPIEAQFSLDDVRIYNRVLNDAEIKTLAGKLPPR